MPETIAPILGFLPGWWEVYVIHTTAGHKTSSELIGIPFVYFQF